MTPEILRNLIAAGETISIEFKGEEKSSLNDNELIESVICLANRLGDDPGWLLIGVEDDGRVTGARPRHEGGKTDPTRVQALITNRTRPSLSCGVALVALGDIAVLVIEVPSSPMPVGTADGRYLRRIIGGRGKPECVPYFHHEMHTHIADRGFLDYTAFPLPGAKWDDLDPLEFERLRRMVRDSGQGDTSIIELTDLELAKAIGAVEANHEVKVIRLLGLLLFGKEDSIKRLLPMHEVAFQVLSGTSIVVNEFFRLPLFRVIEELASRFKVRNKEKELMIGFMRVGVPDYPERAFREAVANALVHRDYTRMGAVYIQWYDDRMEISNPGGFPEGVRLDNLLVTPPRPRNPLLADAFKRAGIVERTGRGIDTIYYEQLRNGRPAPSYERSTNTDVIVVLPGGEANLQFVRLVVKEGQSGRAPRVDDLLLLNRLFYERRLNTNQASRIIQKSEMETRSVLERLVESGLVQARGERRGRTYHLSVSIYKRLGKELAYIRQRGFEPIQQEQMILQYVRAHGRIRRRQVAELCQVTSEQARNLLTRLVGNGLLELHGRTRGAYYTAKK